MKVHIDFKGKPLCGRKRIKNKLRFVPKGTTFDELPEKQKCGSCRRAQDR